MDKNEGKKIKDSKEKIKQQNISKVTINEEKRDTSGDTKVFQIIRREDIEREKRRQAIEAEKRKKVKDAVKVGQVNDAARERHINDAVKIKQVNEEAKIRQAKQAERIKQINGKIKTGQGNFKGNQINKITQENQIKKEEKINQSVETSKKIQAISKENINQKNQINMKKADNSNEKTTSNKELVSNKADNNKKHNALKIVLLIIVFILIATIFSTIFGVLNLNSNKIINGVKVNDVTISNLSKEQALDKLNDSLNNGENNFVTIRRNNYEAKISVADIDGKFEVENIINNAYNVGRESNLISNNYKAIKTFILGENLKANFTYNEELLDKKIDEISLQMPDLAIDASYIIDGNKLIIKDGTDGVKIQKENFKQSLINALSSSNKQFELPIEKAENREIDIKQIYEEVHKEPVNAYYTTNPLKVYKEENGIDFAISLDEAAKIVKEKKTEYEIPLKEIKAQITIADLGDAAFPDTLSTFTTTYGTADVNRNANIALAAKSINSVVVMPGETFSYNDLIGECSPARGYKTSTIYLNGKLSTGIGGGICQVSTTLYNAVLRANLEIVQRRNHSLGVTYVPAGQDAMVNIGTSDFKFKNNREYPVKVIAYVNPGSVTCAIKGIKQDTEYEVKLESATIEKTEEKYKVQTFKVLYLNGNIVSRTWLSTDTYKYH